ncbi:16S rRNA (cytosine(967)-C(5))-methyltransferase RsmB [Rossellomorea marisflavi]|uniref:16S rRNA (cytosine(967)-C(5))-methyltransferase RsmB n=1 Tax=Rossellomorea marisflavi TaxID=189381 RepID=UPI00203F2A3E|nr:16S rRNA (cytosine(967)-C(5))-methyltransferase RsmB [Rossellomorea marisflavi]MCM2603533.1 16S rRNA (cytosine(967)-C(5))-methyltransferase RsmB [Rossellomorea marisflavi]
MSKKTVREAALEVIEAVEKNQSYSNLLLNHVIEKNDIPSRDVGLLTELTYGTIQRKMTLDYYLKPFLRGKVESWVRQLLRMSLYQLVYLDRIPDRAVFYEAVEIAKKRGHKGISGMVNGVLRSVQRKGLPSLEDIQDPIERVSVETSHPLWLVKRWSDQFGLEKTKAMCETNLLASNQTARVNPLKGTREELLESLTENGHSAQESPIVPEAIQSLRGNLAKTDEYRNGRLTVQDESSMLVAHALKLEEGMRVLDACAAPGGKTTHIAEMLKNTGEVHALDLHAHKVKLIAENAGRLGLANVHARTLDSRKAGEVFEEESFERVLVDAPCSGLGVLRRKPDIKYAKKEQDLNSLQKIQLDILDAASRLLKKDGILVYSTCTVDQNENEGTVKEFLSQHPEFEPHPLDGMPEAVEPFVQGHLLQVFPQDFGGDGFFISCFRKKNG